MMVFSSVDQFNIAPTPTFRPQQQGPQQPNTSITDIVNAGRRFIPSSSSSIGSTSALTGFTNQVGAGLGFGGATPSFIGPLAPGTGVSSAAGSLTATPLAGVLGPAAAGFAAGGIIADLTGGHETGGSVGGATGAAIGSMILPGIGTVVGALIGSLAGSAFGPSDPNVTSEFTSRMGDDGRLTDISIGTKHTGEAAAQMVSTSMDSYLSRVQSITGLSFTDMHIRGGLGGGKEGTGFINLTSSGAKNLDPHREQTDDVTRIEFNINNQDDMNRALTEAAVHLAKVSGADEATIEDIRSIPTQQSAITSGSQARSADGVPLVAPKRSRAKSSFEEFAEEYKAKRNNNA